MTPNAWRLPANADPRSVRFVNGVILFETDSAAPFRISGLSGGLPGISEHILEVHPIAKTATLDGQPCHCTAQCFRLLLEFARQPEAYLSARQLYESVWGGSYDSVKTRAVDLAVYRLRKGLPAMWLTSKPRQGWRLLPPE